MTWHLGHLVQFSITANPCDPASRWQCPPAPGRGARRKPGVTPAGRRAPAAPLWLKAGSCAHLHRRNHNLPSSHQHLSGRAQMGQLSPLNPLPVPGHPHPRRRHSRPAGRCPRPPLPRRPHGNPSPRVPSADEPGTAQAGDGMGGLGANGGGERTPPPRCRRAEQAGGAGGDTGHTAGGRGHRPAWDPRACGAENAMGSDGKHPRVAGGGGGGAALGWSRGYWGGGGSVLGDYSSPEDMVESRPGLFVSREVSVTEEAHF